VPGWFFEDGVVFLPEELEHGMQFKSDYARRCFRQENGDLMTFNMVGHSTEAAARRVPDLRIYPASARLDAELTG